LRHVTWVLAAAVFAVPTLALHVLVAYFIKLLARSPVLAFLVDALLLLLLAAFALGLRGPLLLLLRRPLGPRCFFAGTIIVVTLIGWAVGEATTIAKLALSLLLEVEALSPRRLCDFLSL